MDTFCERTIGANCLIPQTVVFVRVCASKNVVDMIHTGPERSLEIPEVIFGGFWKIENFHELQLFHEKFLLLKNSVFFSVFH